jgi:hypothetical protein
MDKERRSILDMLAKGKITTGEALRLIQALPTEEGTGPALEAGPVEHISPDRPDWGEFPAVEDNVAGPSSEETWDSERLEEAPGRSWIRLGRQVP